MTSTNLSLDVAAATWTRDDNPVDFRDICSLPDVGLRHLSAVRTLLDRAGDLHSLASGSASPPADTLRSTRVVLLRSADRLLSSFAHTLDPSQPFAADPDLVTMWVQLRNERIELTPPPHHESATSTADSAPSFSPPSQPRPSPTADDQPFANWLRDQIDTSELQQTEVAKLLGVTPSAVSHWTTGRGQPNSDNLTELASLFGQPPAGTLPSERAPATTASNRASRGSALDRWACATPTEQAWARSRHRAQLDRARGPAIGRLPNDPASFGPTLADRVAADRSESSLSPAPRLHDRSEMLRWWWAAAVTLSPNQSIRLEEVSAWLASGASVASCKPSWAQAAASLDPVLHQLGTVIGHLLHGVAQAVSAHEWADQNPGQDDQNPQQQLPSTMLRSDRLAVVNDHRRDRWVVEVSPATLRPLSASTVVNDFEDRIGRYGPDGAPGPYRLTPNVLPAIARGCQRLLAPVAPDDPQYLPELARWRWADDPTRDGGDDGWTCRGAWTSAWAAGAMVAGALARRSTADASDAWALTDSTVDAVSAAIEQAQRTIGPRTIGWTWTDEQEAQYLGELLLRHDQTADAG